jgi:hypothetical protein
VGGRHLVAATAHGKPPQSRRAAAPFLIRCPRWQPRQDSSFDGHGARTIIYLATSPEVAGATGGYYVKSQQREPSPAARDDAAARRLWQLSEELTGLTPARPTGT